MASGGDDSEEDGPATTWAEWIVERPGHECLCVVDRAFIEDTFNLYGLRSIFARNFRDCHDIILGPAPRSDAEGEGHHLFALARNLYGLIHARFIVTLRGVQLMVRAALGAASRAPRASPGPARAVAR